MNNVEKAAAGCGTLVGKMLRRFIDDFLLLMGCVLILIGISQWSIPATWITGGLMLIGAAVLVGKVRAKNDTE